MKHGWGNEIFVLKFSRNKSREKSFRMIRRRWEDNIKTDLK
jgi:hypothetical protein